MAFQPAEAFRLAFLIFAAFALVRAEEQIQQALKETEGLLEAAKAILGATDLKDICSNLIRHFNELVQADRTTLILLDQDHKQVQLAIAHGSIEGDMAWNYEEVISGISGMVLKSKQPIISLSADDGIEPEATRSRLGCCRSTGRRTTRTSSRQNSRRCRDGV